MKTFWKGFVTGAAVMLVLVLLVTAFRFFWERDRKIFEAMEKEREIEMLQEDIGNRDAYEFLNDNAGVRGAAGNGIEGFRKQRDEILQRIRGGYVD
jgi:hypothetical protein